MGKAGLRDLPGAGATVPMTGTVLPATDMIPSTSTGDLESATHRANSDVTVRDIRRKQLGRSYADEPKHTIMIAPMYEAYFGKNMHVSINGISISVPCDGRPYAIPETFAAEVQSRLRAINDLQAKQKRFSDVGRNYESSPGELALH